MRTTATQIRVKMVLPVLIWLVDMSVDHVLLGLLATTVKEVGLNYCDNTYLQSTFFSVGCSGEIDLYFVLDSSGSIRVERYPQILKFVADIISQLDVHQDRTRVGLIYWSDNAHMLFTLDQYTNRENAMQAVMRTPFLGEKTNTASALEMLYKQGFTVANGDRINANNIAIVITDGNSNINPKMTPKDAIEARTAGIHLMVVAVGSTFVNYGELEAIASTPTDLNILNVDHYEDLNTIKDQLVLSTCDGE